MYKKIGSFYYYFRNVKLTNESDNQVEEYYTEIIKDNNEIVCVFTTMKNQLYFSNRLHLNQKLKSKK